jgi:hypothetical protein
MHVRTLHRKQWNEHEHAACMCICICMCMCNYKHTDCVQNEANLSTYKTRSKSHRRLRISLGTFSDCTDPIRDLYDSPKVADDVKREMAYSFRPAQRSEKREMHSE